MSSVTLFITIFCYHYKRSSVDSNDVKTPVDKKLLKSISSYILRKALDAEPKC